MARRLGATEEQLDGVARGDYAAFEPGWRAALRYADAMTRTPPEVTAAVYDELARHWDAGQIVEITAVVSLFAYFNRFAIALDVPPTR